MRFYVRPGPLKRQLAPLITYGGGIMCRVQEPGAFLLADPGQSHGIQYMSSSYITDCVSSNRRLSPRSYRLRHRRDRRTLSPEGPHRERGAEQSHSTGGPRENPPSTGGPRENPPSTGDPRENPPSTGGPRENPPSTGDPRENPPSTGGPRENPPSTGGPRENPPSTGGPRENPPSTGDPRENPPSTGAPASCDPGPSTRTPASCDPGPSTRTPASCDPGPSTGAPVSCDPGPSTGDPVSCDPGPSTGDPVSCDPGPSTGVSAKKDTGAEQMESRGYGGGPIGLGTHRGCGATEDHQAKCSQVSQQWTVPSRRASGPVGRVRFSREEDIAILQYVQENEGPKRTVTGNVLWLELEKKQLLQRTWQAMKCRYKKYILPHRHQYKRTPGTSTVHHRDPPSAEARIALTAQHEDPLPAGTSPGGASPPAAGSGGAREAALCTDLCTDDGRPQEGNTGTQPLTIAREGALCTDVCTDDGRSQEGNTVTQPLTIARDAKSKGEKDQQRVRPEDPDSDQSEELHIFQLANLEFELDDESPAVSLADFVMGEDSLSAELPADEGLQEALSHLMRDFRLDISQVTQALLKNNGEVGSTRGFLRSGRRPDGFPVWEHKDDLELQKKDPTLQVQLERKYGAHNVAKRLAFLAS